MGAARGPGAGPTSNRGTAPAILWSPEPEDAVRCIACAHRCLIRPGRRGICQVRENRAGRLVTLVHGEAVALAVDPIEKKPLFHVYPGSTAFSVATRGCNFHCSFCQNWQIAQADRIGAVVPATHVPPADLVASAVRAGSRAVAYTYVEPTVFIEYVLDTSRLARRAGLANVLVTNGYASPEAIDQLAPWIDAANVDLKSFSDAFYRRTCGARLAPVLETLIDLRRRGIWLEVTTLLIPGLNDDAGELRQLTAWIVRELGAETPWHVSRFLPAFRMLGRPPTPLATIERAVRIGLEQGLRHVYPGNLDGGTADTRCAACDAVLICRRGFRVTDNRLRAGACPGCGYRLAGIGLAPEGQAAGVRRLRGTA